MLYNLDNSRSPAQTMKMRRLTDEGKCFLCSPEGYIYATANWYVKPNDYPYHGTTRHILLIPRQHVEDLVDLTEYHFAEMHRVLRWVRTYFFLDHYSMAARCGDMHRTGATAAHAHLHVIVGNGQGIVRFKVAQ